MTGLSKWSLNVHSLCFCNWARIYTGRKPVCLAWHLEKCFLEIICSVLVVCIPLRPQSLLGQWSLLDSQQRVPSSGSATSGVPDRSQVAIPMWGDSSEPAGGPSSQTADCPRSDVVHVLSSSLRGPGLPGAFCFVDDSQFCFTYPRPTPL